MNLLRRVTFICLAAVLGLGLCTAFMPNASACEEPTYDTATVDGNTGEWDLTNDFFADMYRAGDPTKVVESKLYLRYDCDKDVMYALVLAVDGVPVLVQPDNAWIAIDGASNKPVNGNDNNDGTPPDFAWVGKNNGEAQGWEASFGLDKDQTYTILAHTNVFDDGEEQTSATDRKTNQDGICLAINCGPPTPNASIDVEKFVSIDNRESWLDADESPGPDVEEGSNVYFKFVVTNNGNVELTNISLTDSVYDLSSCVATDPLAAGASFECEIDEIEPITAVAGQHTNTATAEGYYDGTPYGDTDDANYYGTPAQVTPATIGDFVWHDYNANGIQDEGEPGLNGQVTVTVNLYECGGTVAIDTTTTDEHGNYTFSVDPNGSYYIEFVAPENFLFSPKDQGGDDAKDSDADETGKTVCITDLLPGGEYLDWDAGLYEPAHIGDAVWHDLNANGIQDEGESGIPDVTVNLYECGGTEPIKTTTTNIDGFYEFIGLTPGGYYVGFVAPDGYVFSPQNQGDDPEKDSDADTETGKTECTTLTSGENDHSWDAGLYQYASIGDTVWRDSDADGVYEPGVGELPISGVVMELYDCDGTVVIASTTTDVDGLYQFTELVPGCYEVVVAAGNFEVGGALYGDDSQTYDYDGTLDNMTSKELISGEDFLDADFGYRPSVQPGTGTPGYWKNTPEAWPVEEITIGGDVYTKAEAIAILETAEQGDKQYTMFRSLISAKLNVGIGNDSSCTVTDTICSNLEEVIIEADAWMAEASWDEKVKAGGPDSLWRRGEDLYLILDAYNNGLLCAPPRV